MGLSGSYKSDRSIRANPLLLTISASVDSAFEKSRFHKYTFPNRVFAATDDALPPASANSSAVRYDVYVLSFIQITYHQVEDLVRMIWAHHIFHQYQQLYRRVEPRQRREQG